MLVSDAETNPRIRGHKEVALDKFRTQKRTYNMTFPLFFHFIDCGAQADTVVHTSTFTATK